jgi:hypothetical protein
MPSKLPEEHITYLRSLQECDSIVFADSNAIHTFVGWCLKAYADETIHLAETYCGKTIEYRYVLKPTETNLPCGECLIRSRMSYDAYMQDALAVAS